MPEEMTEVHSLHLDPGKQHLATSPSRGSRHRLGLHHVPGTFLKGYLPPCPEPRLNYVDEGSREKGGGGARGHMIVLNDIFDFVHLIIKKTKLIKSRGNR